MRSQNTREKGNADLSLAFSTTFSSQGNQLQIRAFDNLTGLQRQKLRVEGLLRQAGSEGLRFQRKGNLRKVNLDIMSCFALRVFTES